MFRNFRLQAVVVPLIAVAATMALACPRAAAQVTPFRITGGGPAPQGISLIPLTPVPHSAVGQATMLGRYAGAGMFQILNFTSPLTANFSSAPDFVFVAANGDKLAVTYGVVANGAAQPGQVTLTPNADGSFTATFVAEFNPEPAKCTGRFANVTGGSWIMVAMSDPFFITGVTTTPFNYRWEGQGYLVFGADSRRRAGQAKSRAQALAAQQAMIARLRNSLSASRQTRPATRLR